MREGYSRRSKSKAKTLLQFQVSTHPHQYSHQYFQITEMGVNHDPVLWAKATRDRLAVRSHPPESVLKSGPSSLNHHDQKVNTVHESITWGGELKARHPRVSLIQTTNLSDSQIIGNLLDSVEKEIFTLIIHSVRGCISSPLCYKKKVRPHWCTEQATKCNARMEMNLYYLILCFLASSLLLFVSPIFFPLSPPPSSHPFWLAGDSNPVPFLLLLYCHKHSASHTHSLNQQCR